MEIVNAAWEIALYMSHVMEIVDEQAKKSDDQADLHEDMICHAVIGSESAA